MLQQTGWHDALFVEAVADHRGRAIAWNSDRQKLRCCKSCNRTILGERVRGWTVAGPVQWLWLVAFLLLSEINSSLVDALPRLLRP